MITKLTLVQQYSKYLDAISKDNGKQIPTYFKKFTSFLRKNCEDKELQVLLELDSIGKTLVQVKKKDIRLKELAENWSRTSIEEFYRILKILNQLVRSDEGNTDTYRVNFGKLVALLNKQKDPCVILYMYLCHSNSIDGERLYTNKDDREMVRRLMGASTEEEIDNLLQVQ